MKSQVVGLVAIILVLASLNCEASILGTHARTTIAGSGSGNPSTYYNSQVTGTTNSFQSDSGFGNGNGYQYVESWASMNVESASYIQGVRSYSTSDRSGMYVPNGTAFSRSSWRDLVFVNNAAVGDTIRMEFSVDGYLAATDDGSLSDNADAIMYLHTSSSENGFYDLSGNNLNYASQRARLNSNGSFTVGGSAGFTSYSFNPLTGYFQGTFEFVSQYNTNYDAFGMGLVLLTETHAKSGTALADFSQSVSLTDIYGPDGRRLNASEYDFDSGFAFQTVPEPTSFLIWSALGFASVRLRRRKSQ